jgi:hypothetical protein
MAAWSYQILPYMELETIYKAPTFAQRVGGKIPSYFCPSRRSPTTVVINDSSGVPTPRGLLDYAAAGSNDWDWGVDNFWWSPRDMRGIIIRSYPGADAKVTLSQGSIPDGTSNTIMVAEKWLNANNYQSGDWHDDFGYTDGWDPDIVRFGSLPPVQDRPGGTGYGWEGWQFGSAHTSSFNALWGDRSVRPVKYSVNLTSFRLLCDRRDGVVVDTSDL